MRGERAREREREREREDIYIYNKIDGGRQRERTKNRNNVARRAVTTGCLTNEALLSKIKNFHGQLDQGREQVAYDWDQ